MAAPTTLETIAAPTPMDAPADALMVPAPSVLRADGVFPNETSGAPPAPLATNHVIIVGMLDTMLVRERTARTSGGSRVPPARTEVTTRAGRDRRTGGRWAQITLQVRSPYGGMFALATEVAPDAPGADLIAHVAPDTLLVVEGHLQLKATFDPRFATDHLVGRGWSDRGHPTRRLCLHVGRVRRAGDQEAQAGSAVWLEGEVLEPPQITRHADLPTIQLAGTLLRVVLLRPAGVAGVPTTTPEVVEVNVSIPTVHPDAGALYRQGNRVRVIGQIDCRMEYQHGAAVTAKLDDLDAAWAAQKAGLQGQPGAVRRAEEAYRRTRQRLEASARLYVLAGSVGLVTGEPGTLEETYAQRRAFVHARRTRQEARRVQRTTEQAQRVARAAQRPGARDAEEEAPLSADDVRVGDGDGRADAGERKAPRPRRRVIEGERTPPMEGDVSPLPDSDVQEP